jgi:dienelactone hydrolase
MSRSAINSKKAVAGMEMNQSLQAIRWFPSVAAAFLFASFMVVASAPESAFAKIKTETVEYKDGATVLEGYIAYDPARAKAPGVLVVHEWYGLGPYTKRRAEQLAGLGYVAFAADIYAKGVRATDNKQAGELAGKYKNDRALMRSRARAGLEALKARKEVNSDKLAAIGYCFGGTTVLELARSGAPVSGTVSFHGGLDTPTPADAKNIKGKVLVLHGADDPFVPAKDVAAFEDEMRLAGVDWQLVKYAKAVHSFTNPDSGNDPKKGAAYNLDADRRSWEAMKDFLAEVLGPIKVAKP